MLRRRLSRPRAATAVALAAVLAAAVAVTPSFAGSAISGAFITKKAAGHDLRLQQEGVDALPEEKSRRQHLREEGRCAAAARRRRSRPAPPPRSERRRRPPVYIPTAFTSFATPGTGAGGDHVLGLRRPASRPNRRWNSPARSRSWSTASRPAKSTSPRRPRARRHRPRSSSTVTQTTVLRKAATRSRSSTRAPNVVFTLKGWNLAVQAYPAKPEESPPTETTKSTK